jgi:DNA modification methylase
MRRPMQNNSSPGQAVYEPFLGSGTTLIAAETSGRVCFAMELESRYVDVAIRRWQAFTGLNATLQNDGRTFERVTLDRAATADAGSPRSAEESPINQEDADE